jgi:6 kDa early secretory antigenic target
VDNGLLVVNFASLSNASGSIGSAVAELNSKLDYLKAKGSALAETWEGSAKNAYYERQETWTNAALDLTQILQKIQLAVQDSADDYLNTERKATNRFQ